MGRFFSGASPFLCIGVVNGQGVTGERLSIRLMKMESQFLELQLITGPLKAPMVIGELLELDDDTWYSIHDVIEQERTKEGFRKFKLLLKQVSLQ